MNEELNTDDRADLVAGWFDQIKHLNHMVAQLQTDANLLAVEEFTARHEKYVRELNHLP